MATFEVRTVVMYAFEEGYGAYFIPIWEGEDEDGTESERISDVDGGIVKIASDTTELVGNVPCIRVDRSLAIPVENFLVDPEEVHYDDTHDLRDRWFPTQKEAEEHVAYTLHRFQNPQPWESFIRTA